MTKKLSRHLTAAEFLQIAQVIYDDKEYGSGWEDHFKQRCGISDRTLRRWKGRSILPGPVRAMILAHEKCHHYGVEF